MLMEWQTRKVLQINSYDAKTNRRQKRSILQQISQKAVLHDGYKEGSN